MKTYHIYFSLKIILFFAVLSGCSSNEKEAVIVQHTKLTDYETLIAVEDNILANPSLLKQDEDSNLIIFDQGTAKVILANKEDGEVINEYGRAGNGPGEFVRISNLFYAEEKHYFVDSGRFLIHQYHQDGHFISSYEYLPDLNMAPPPPPIPPLSENKSQYLTAVDSFVFNDLPFVTATGSVIIPAFENSEYFYDVGDWEKTTSISLVERSAYSSPDETGNYRRDISNRDIPLQFKTNNFFVQDNSRQDEYYVVFDTIPMLAKYHISGNKLWQSSIDRNPESDSITSLYFETAGQILSIADMQIPIRKYWAGTSSCDGELFLSTYHFDAAENHLFIHRFSDEGELLERYQPIADHTLFPVFEVNCPANKLFFISENAEILVYDF